jgi:preprotein translocase subunit SecG
MLLGLLLALNILVCLALIGVVLMQRSEGGALGGGGTPGGLITTRGAGDLLTRTTWILFGVFLAISLTLTLVGGHQRSSDAILNRLKSETVNPASLPARPAAPTPKVAPIAPAAPPPALPSTPGGFLAAPKPTIGGPATPAPPQP